MMCGEIAAVALGLLGEGADLGDHRARPLDQLIRARNGEAAHRGIGHSRKFPGEPGRQRSPSPAEIVPRGQPPPQSNCPARLPAAAAPADCGLDNYLASFETAASRPPQMRFFLSAIKNYLILRSAQRARLEGRTTPAPRGFRFGRRAVIVRLGEDRVMARNGFRLIDAEMHVMEPTDLWQRYIDPSSPRARAAARRAPLGHPHADRGRGHGADAGRRLAGADRADHDANAAGRPTQPNGSNPAAVNPLTAIRCISTTLRTEVRREDADRTAGTVPTRREAAACPQSAAQAASAATAGSNGESARWTLPPRTANSGCSSCRAWWVTRSESTRSHSPSISRITDRSAGIPIDSAPISASSPSMIAAFCVAMRIVSASGTPRASNSLIACCRL